MSCKSNPHPHLRRLTVTDFTKQDLLYILPQCCTQPSDKGQSCLRTYFKLTDSVNAPLHGILKGHNMTGGIVQFCESRIKRRRLAGVHRPTDEKEPCGPMDES